VIFAHHTRNLQGDHDRKRTKAVTGESNIQKKEEVLQELQEEEEEQEEQEEEEEEEETMMTGESNPQEEEGVEEAEERKTKSVGPVTGKRNSDPPASGATKVFKEDLSEEEETVIQDMDFVESEEEEETVMMGESNPHEEEVRVEVQVRNQHYPGRQKQHQTAVKEPQVTAIEEKVPRKRKRRSLDPSDAVTQGLPSGKTRHPLAR